MGIETAEGLELDLTDLLDDDDLNDDVGSLHSDGD